MAEQFVREVDDELREERTQRLARALLPGLAVAFVIVAATVVGYHFWTTSRARADLVDFARYEAALAANPDEARALYEALAEEGVAGYAALAQLRLASAARDAGLYADAATRFRALARDSRATPLLQRYALVQAAKLEFDTASFADIEAALAGVAAEQSPLGAQARELLGFAAMKAGDGAAARRHLTSVVSDPEASPLSKRRAQSGLDLLNVDVSEGPADGEGEE